MSARVSQGDEFPSRYAYGDRPMREEIVETIGARGDGAAIVTRNRYGSLVLNTARLLFLDVDLPPAKGGLARLFGRGQPPEAQALEKLREGLRANSDATFRLYRTAAGLRALAVDREFTPEDAATERLMAATGTDVAFMRLCRVQKSFRARLTPKPWRCGVSAPPGEFPREDSGTRARFDDWLARYEQASTGHATCRFLEQVGEGRPLAAIAPLVERHDRVTRANEELKLA
jgi:hypothetical protein